MRQHCRETRKQKTKAGEATFDAASCLEIYNEELSDLFAIDDDTTQKTTSAARSAITKTAKKASQTRGGGEQVGRDRANLGGRVWGRRQV